MEQMQEGTVSAAGLGTTALGRLHLRVREDDGYEEVIIERRWGDLASARSWCERTISRAAEDTAVLEIQVFEESWHHGRSWETTGSRPIAQTLQLGVVSANAVIWSEQRQMSPRSSTRYAR